MAYHQQYYQYGQMPPMNPLYNHMPHKNEHENYQGAHTQLKHSKSTAEHKKKDNAGAGQQSSQA